MSDDEAAHLNKPQSKAVSRVKRSVRRTINAYFFAICVLFILLAALSYNNVSIYLKYTNAEQKYTGAFENILAVKAYGLSLVEEKEKLKGEKEKLAKKYSSITGQNSEIMKMLEEIKRQNEELVKKNKELMEDNIALQNTLKMAAAVGVKPQSFTKFSGFSSRGEIDRGTYAGKFTGTAYTPSAGECGNSKGITNSGKPIIPGISLAVDGKYWPFGTTFYIKGLGYAVAMDTGSAIKGKHRFDFAVFDKKFAKTLGVREWDVYLVKLGNGDVGKLEF
jgi:3D (Asp-Asp-Asp) domain-containing protein